MEQPNRTDSKSKTSKNDKPEVQAKSQKKKVHNKRSAEHSQKEIIGLLKRKGPADAIILAKELELTPMAVRQHLYELHKEEFLTTYNEPRKVGRPAKIWALTPKADIFFPDEHSELAVSLLNNVRKALGPAQFKKVLQSRQEEKIAEYSVKIKPNYSVLKKLQILAEIRTGEGYEAEVRKEKNGEHLFIENHCPICKAAQACAGLCEIELNIFKKVIGEEHEIIRTEHIIDGQRRCVYSIK